MKKENTSAIKLSYPAKPQKKGLLIHNFIDDILNGNWSGTAQKEFNLMSSVLAADKSMETGVETEVKYLQC